MLHILCAILCFLHTFNICCLAPGDLPAMHRSITTRPFDLFFALFCFVVFLLPLLLFLFSLFFPCRYITSFQELVGQQWNYLFPKYFLLISQYKAKLVRAFTENSVPLFAAGKLKNIVDSVLPMDQIQLAHEEMESNKNIGKIVVQIAAPWRRHHTTSI